VVAAASFTGPQEPLFAWQQVAYLGQPLGLVLASSQAAAAAGAAAVKVHYRQQQQCDAGKGTHAAGSEGANGVQENGKTPDDSGHAGSCEDGSGLTSLSAAVAAGSWYDVSKLPTKAAKGAQEALLHLQTP
jgi:hypothetical protein